MNLHESMYTKFVDEKGVEHLLIKFVMFDSEETEKEGFVVELKTTHWYCWYKITKEAHSHDEGANDFGSGSIKWDGCSDTHYNNFHFCGGATEWIVLSNVMKVIWNTARSLMSMLKNENGQISCDMDEWDNNFSITTKYLEAKPW